MQLDELKELAEYLLRNFKHDIKSIYLGGSLTDEIIKNSRDIDIIVFVKNHVIDVFRLYKATSDYNNKYNKTIRCDFIQLVNENRSYTSYLNELMIKLVGEDISFTFDILDKNRKEYIDALKEAVILMSNTKKKSKWYNILRGYFILKNNSYTMTEEQIDILNKVHDNKLEYKISLEDLNLL